MNCTKLSDFEKQCPNVDCNTAKCPIFRKVVIPSNMGSDEEGQPYAPENGAYENALVYYEASGVSYIYSSDGIYTKIAQITGGQGEVISVNGKKGVVTITIDELDGLTADQIVSRINSAKTEDKAYTDAKIAQVEAEISTINSKIPAEASVSNQLADKTFVSGLVSDEASARELADTNLQGQIDAITSASDVVDVVGTYSELQAYDTQHLKDNDIVKVLVDETHDNAITYYRWTHSTTPYSWIYIGSQGPFYTKAESDTLLNEKADKSNTYTKTEVDTALAGKVDKVAGKGLSTNDFTTEEKTKLAGLENTVLESTTGQSTTAGMTQKAITDALASAGGIKVLTTADYNWNTGGGQQEPYDCVAPFLLDKGIYQVPSSGIKVALTNSDIVNNQFMTLFVSDKFYAPFECRRVIVIQKDVEIASYLTALNNGAIIKKENYLTAQQVVDSLTSTANDVPLSASQGKVLKDLIDSLVISGAGAPTTSTVGTVGKLYEDTTNGDLYQCTAVSGSTYTWEEVGGGGGGPTVVQTTGQSTTDVMSQKATTDMIKFNSGIRIGATSTDQGPYAITIGIGSGIHAIGNASVAIGDSAWATATNSMAIGPSTYTSANATRGIALGYRSKADDVNVSIGNPNQTELYKNTGYRKITNVYDGENAHDAMTVGQANALIDAINAALNTNIAHIGASS